jgi:hypothetical protein
MHRLVHIAMPSWLSLNDELISWDEKTLELITDTCPRANHENKAVWDEPLPYAQCIIALTKSYIELEELQYRILHNAGSCFSIIRKYTEAKAMYLQALPLQCTDKH